MKSLSLFLLLTSALSLMSCASGPRRQKVAGGEQVSFPAQHISFFLPHGWKVSPTSKEGRLMSAACANDVGPTGGIVMALVRAPDTSHRNARDPYLLKDSQRSLALKGFTKFSKPQLVRVGGREAMRSEAQKPDGSQSLLSYSFIEPGYRVGLVFSYYAMPITRSPAVQRIVDSFTLGK
ncbi:hypothetical protein [Prosthecobacter sp.]|uniref:hypothetical protein n=1 Tax=Prosthecobacter sp. TaxID=1965333 RepID=UPI003784D589